MSQPVIRVEGLSKQYRLGGDFDPYGTLYDAIGRRLGLARGRASAARHEEFWALKDVDFAVEPGEVLGIVGRNGAGKSTLLKILSRITAPTAGRARIRGRLASLLEVGTGFHPELSGRENIFLNGAILGMRRTDVQRRFDEIVAFAEIQGFVDTPVKRYSSGMYVRLAFAVAAHLEPDVLVVDEVLAVGDAGFQAKCLGKMDAIGRGGATVLVVSHNVGTMRKLCTRAILLEKGRLAYEGPVDEVCARYTAGSQQALSRWTPPSPADSQPFQYDEVFVREGDDGNPRELCFRFRLSRPLTGRIALVIRDALGNVVLTSSDTDAHAFVNKRWEPGRYEESCVLPFEMLVPGRYAVTISRPVAEGNEVINDACMFEVHREHSLVARDGREGMIAPLLPWRCEVLA